MGINRRTLSPDILVNVVRVIRCEDEKIVVQPLTSSSFSGVVDEECIDEEYAWCDVVEMEWRVVSFTTQSQCQTLLCSR
jgi:hypothetical protein